MNDFGDIYQAMNEEKRKRHARWKVKNTEIIVNSGLLFDWAGQETILFRMDDKLKVDFYPSTGRWRVIGNNRTFSGGAKNFINWYRKQKSGL